MIEAVNSVIANASSLRPGAEVISTIRTAADVAPIAQVGETVVQLPQAPYISPYIVIDRNYNKAVLQIRDSDTGDVVQQFPTESRLAQISHAQQMHAQKQVAQGRDVKTYQVNVEPTPRPAERSVITVQEVTSAPPSNAPAQVIAAFSAGAQAGESAQASSVSVFA